MMISLMNLININGLLINAEKPFMQLEVLKLTANPKYKKWTAYCKTKEKRYYLGSFDTEKEAAEAYNKKVIDVFGEFAKLNVIED